MKKLLSALTLCVSFSAFASQPQFADLTKDQVQKVSKEFGANFSHTSVAAPETDGLWGLEVGVIGGRTRSPHFADVVDASGGKGSDFKNIYHAGVMARAHFPFDLFLEGTYLPEQTISDVKIKSSSLGLGWNFGGFFSLPLDLAVGLDYSTGDVKFHQDQDLANSVPDSNIRLKTKTTTSYIGASKTFSFFTPYVKAGVTQINGNLDATANIFNISGKTSQSVSTSGSYLALGANFQFFFMKLGIEGSQIQSVQRLSGKLSFDF